MLQTNKQTNNAEEVFGKFYLPEVLSNDLLDFSPASQIPPFPPASVAACAEICNGDEDM